MSRMKRTLSFGVRSLSRRHHCDMGLLSDRAAWTVYAVFAAAGMGGEDLFDPSLRKRTGTYPEYHSGDINALHLSYFRRKYAEERAFRTCNLRKSRGFHLAAMGADPLPSPDDADSPYRMKLIKDKGYVHFSINGLPILEWMDDGSTYGPVLTKGKIGFRQMAPMKAVYRDFAVHQAVRR